MSELHSLLIQLLNEDSRYKPEAYFFVRDALSFAQEGMGSRSKSIEGKVGERHLSGQELCQAIRQFAIKQYGYMALPVFSNWGIVCTGDFGEIVYNMIRHDVMRKSEDDRREDFNDVYEFNDAFVDAFEFRDDEGEGEDSISEE